MITNNLNLIFYAFQLINGAAYLNSFGKSTNNV
jgi:hypothetical protein